MFQHHPHPHLGRRLLTCHFARGGRGPFGHGPFAGGPGGFGGPGPFGFGGGGPRGPRGGAGRLFAQGALRLVFLQLIAEQPRHGYDLIRAVEERVGGAYAPSPGVVYPTLTWLEDLGYIAAQPGEGAKKLYAITPEGRAHLEAHRGAVDALLARMDAARAAAAGGAPGGPFGGPFGGQAPPVARAVENLRLALHLRLGRGPLTKAEAQAVAAALDAAATAVERA